MNLPNDLIKATDYSKAKNREIHEFEYRNGKYIHKYVLGGEHELTPQEIVDCLNAISTIDCDLQTAYAFIQSQKDKINSLENGIVDDETLNTLVKEHKLYKDLETKLADLQQEQIKEMQEHQEAMELADKTITNLVEDNRASQEWYKKQLADTEEQNKRVLEKLELIVRANQELEKKLAEKDELIETLKNKYECTDRELYLTKDTLKHHTNIYNSLVEHRNQDKISFCIEQLEKVKEYIKTNLMSFQKVPIIQEINNQIKRLEEGE